MSNPQNPADGKHVVIQNGQRASKTMTEEDAQREAKRLNRVNESQGTEATEGQRATVKTNLYG